MYVTLAQRGRTLHSATNYIIMSTAQKLQLLSKAASKGTPTAAGAFTTLHGSVRDPKQTTETPVDSSLGWDQLADKLARRAFVVLKIPTKGEAKRLGEMKDNFREILAQEFTPTTETNPLNFPPTVLGLLANQKRKLLEEEQARLDESNSALREATNFTKTSHPALLH